MLAQVTSLGLLVSLTVGPSPVVPPYVMPNDRRAWAQPIQVATTDQRATSGASTMERVYPQASRNRPHSSVFEMEYGAVLKANPKKVIVPSSIRFRNESEVEAFQRRSGVASLRIGNVRVELQPRALQAFKAAREEASLRGLTIGPRGTRASRRSYLDTVRLWHSRVEPGLRHWVSLGKLSPASANALRSLSSEQQLSPVLALESKGLYFGNRFQRPILRSVAAPGTSQHLVMLALDIKEHDDPRVRSILAKHGWFQTVQGDTPHFTYLGVDAARLPALGLKRSMTDGRTFWVLKGRPAKANSKSGHARELVSAGADSKDLNRVRSLSNNAIADKALVSPESSGVIINPNTTRPEKALGLRGRLVQRYFKVSGHFLHITSAFRSPRQQAAAMYGNLTAYGIAHVLRVYKRRAAARAIVAAYRSNRRSRAKAIAAMTSVIQGQVKKNLFVSRHMRGRAFDVRLSSARPDVLRSVVQNMGGQVGFETNHYHVQF
jgi:hypothetical protein